MIFQYYAPDGCNFLIRFIATHRALPARVPVPPPAARTYILRTPEKKFLDI